MDYFKDLFVLLKNTRQMLFAAECIKNIEDDNIIFHAGSLISKSQVYVVYKDRYEVQRTVTNAKVLGYEELLENISKFNGRKIRVMTLVTKDNSYIVFTDEMLKSLIGILKSPYTNIEKTLNVEKELVSKGLSSNYLKYFKGLPSN